MTEENFDKQLDDLNERTRAALSTSNDKIGATYGPAISDTVNGKCPNCGKPFATFTGILTGNANECACPRPEPDEDEMISKAIIGEIFDHELEIMKNEHESSDRIEWVEKLKKRVLEGGPVHDFNEDGVCPCGEKSEAFWDRYSDGQYDGMDFSNDDERES